MFIDVVLVVVDMVWFVFFLIGVFIVELICLLLGCGGVWVMFIVWLEQWVGVVGQCIDELVVVEGQQQVVDQVFIGNSIGSLCFFFMMDWCIFVEDMSVVEQWLWEDLMVVYVQMDFGICDVYCYVVEKIVCGSCVVEECVVIIVLDLVWVVGLFDGLCMYVGYWFVGEGLYIIVEVVVQIVLCYCKVWLLVYCVLFVLYLLLIMLLVVLVIVGLLVVGSGVVLVWLVVLFGLLVFSELGIVLVNWIVMVLVIFRLFLKFDFSEGIFVFCVIVVVVLLMLFSIDGIDVLSEVLEVCFLVNCDFYLCFVLLMDFFDVVVVIILMDDILFVYVVVWIEELNCCYVLEYGDCFYFLYCFR